MKNSCAINKVLSVLSILWILFFPTGCQVARFSKLSKQISRCQLKTTLRKTNFNVAHEVRLELFHLGKLYFFNKSDTLFIVESSDLQSGEIFGQIWNSHSEIKYSKINTEFSFKESRLFTGYMLNLINKWDTLELKKEGEKSNIFPNNSIYATRIVFIDGKTKIDCISFKDFYNPERDRW